MRSARHLPRALLLGALVVVSVGCGSEDGDPASDGARTRAVEQLEDFGLTPTQAGCVVDEIGAGTVVEAGDLTALAESQQYRDAAEACIDDD